MKINCNLAANNLSFGFCSYNILRELFRRKIDVNWFPIANNVDLSAFDKIEPEFVQWLQNSINNSLKNYRKEDPTLKLWHIQNSHEQIGQNQYLYTFHETDQLTQVETNILNQQKKIFVSSTECKQVFEDAGVTVPVIYAPLGFDKQNFYNLNKKYYSDNVTVWSIFGKFEMRKSTMETIKLWASKFGNNSDHVLHLSVTNPFFKPEDNSALINQALDGKRYFNINPLPYVKTLSEYNDIINATDIVIDMSKAEGFSLPSFTALALGKHGIIHNCSAMKDWANSNNAVMVEPSGKIKAVDGIFFHGQGDFNIGNFYKWEEKDLLDAFDKVLEKKKQNKVNIEGLKLQNDFNFEKTVDIILRELV